MKQIIIASNNKHKLEEISRILEGYKLLTLHDIGYHDDIIEDGETYKDNATIKAKAIYNYTRDTEYANFPILADDSGLSVNALDGAPGVYSARYSGEGDEGNRQKLLKELEGKSDRSAYFTCCMVLMYPDGKIVVREGKTFGTITHEKIGDDSFGYDCLFLSTPLGKTFGEATSIEKDSVSHRNDALLKIRECLK